MKAGFAISDWYGIGLRTDGYWFEFYFIFSIYFWLTWRPSSYVSRARFVTKGAIDLLLKVTEVKVQNGTIVGTIRYSLT
jgi:hypothetical protein